MSMPAVTHILLQGLTFPESPRWYDNSFWFSDFYAHQVVRLELDGSHRVVALVPQRPSGLGWRHGQLMVVSMLDRKVLLQHDKGLVEVNDLSSYATGPCNDLVMDAHGRAYIGNFGFDRHGGQTPRTTCLVCIEPDGQVRRVAEDVFFPNGMVITPDGRTLVVAESLGECLTAFDIDEAGNLHHRRVFASLPGSFPDGICLDEEGAIWVADPYGKRVVRVFEGGRIDQSYTFEDRGCYACMLGGPDRKTLFLCTSSTVGPMAAEKKDGRIETLRVQVAGAGRP